MTTDLELNNDILSAPLYVAGISVEEIKERYGLDSVIKLASNENPLGPSPKALAAMREVLPNISRYPPVADDSLRERLAATLGHGLTPENFVTAKGCGEVLGMIGRAFVRKGDEVIICPPTFLLYEIFTKMNGGQCVFVELEGKEFRYNLDKVLDRINDRTRLIFICNPNNPTGGILTQKEMDRFLAQVPPHVIVIIDEAYCHFVTEDDFPDSLAYVQQEHNVIVTRTFSKVYGLAGLRVGFCVARQELAQYLRHLALPFHIDVLALAGAMAALGDQEHVEKTVQLIAVEREYLHSGLAALDLDYIPSQASFISFDAGCDPQLIYEEMLKEGVIVRPMGSFRLPTHVRVSVGTREENERFLAALRRTLDGLKGKEMMDTGPVRQGKLVI